MTAFTSPLEICVPSAIASINWVLVILAMVDSSVRAQNGWKAKELRRARHSVQMRQSHAVRFSFMLMVLKYPGLRTYRGAKGKKPFGLCSGGHELASRMCQTPWQPSPA